MIMYVCQNFGVCEVCGLIPKTSDFPQNFSQARPYLNRMKNW